MKYNKTMIKKVYLIAIAVSTMGLGFAQDNLVDNGSFEDMKKKPKKLGALKGVENWDCPTGMKGDVFCSGKVESVNVPGNVYGTEEAKSGKAYAGVVMFSYGNKMPRTYLMTKLNGPLKKGKKYCIQYNVSLAEGSKYACNQLGAIVTKREFGSESKSSIIEEPTIVTDEIYNAVFGWQKVCGSFIAEGNEKFLTIGNFSSNEDTQSEKNKPPKGMKVGQVIAAYYYIDDVQVLEMTDEVDCSCGVQREEVTYSTVIYQRQIVIEESMTPAEQIEAQELYFGFGNARLTPVSKEGLDLIAKQMTDKPNMKLQILGHSDAEEDVVGEDKPEFSDMSNKRIAEVMNYLKSKGIAESRLIPASQGSLVPNPEIRSYDEDEIAQAKNRRVVFKVR